MTDPGYLLTFVVHLVVALVVSALTSQTRGQARAAQQRESETSALYGLSRDLAVLEDVQSILDAIVIHTEEDFGRQANVWLPVNGRDQTLVAHPQRTGATLAGPELAAAERAFHQEQPAGHGTDSIPEAQAYYLPLRTARRTVGVLSLGAGDKQAHATANEQRLLETFARQAALAIERAQLAEATRQLQVLQVTEKLQSALLNSISHDLRTPLVTVTGALSTLDEDEAVLDDSARRNIVRTAREESERLNRLLENLLNMSRIESGALHVTRQWGDVEDAIGSALEQLGPRLAGRSTSVIIPDELPLVEMDFVLIVQALVNIVDNALKYSPSDAPIEIHARQVASDVQIQVMDRGIGIAEDDLEHVFEKFFRGQHRDGASGTGLGLTIARGIVEAHGGRIRAERRPQGGTIVTLAIPFQADPATGQTQPKGQTR